MKKMPQQQMLMIQNCLFKFQSIWGMGWRCSVLKSSIFNRHVDLQVKKFNCIIATTYKGKLGMIPILNILYYEVDQCNFEVLAKQPDGLQPGRY